MIIDVWVHQIDFKGHKILEHNVVPTCQQETFIFTKVTENLDILKEHTSASGKICNSSIMEN